MRKPGPSRMFTPRILVYSFLAIALAWLMHRHGRLQDRRRQQAERMLDACALQEAGDSARRPGGGFATKRAELKNSRPGECTLPMLIILTDDDGNGHDGAFQAARRKYQGRLSVIRLDCRRDRGCLEYFHAKTLPVAILYSRRNQELGRLEKALTPEALDGWLAGIDLDGPKPNPPPAPPSAPGG